MAQDGARVFAVSAIATQPRTFDPAARARLDGKTVLVTGATSGIGLEASKVLARLGATVALVGRDPSRLSAAMVAVRAPGAPEPIGYLCDFSVQASIRALAADVRRGHPRLDVLVNNAGGANKRRRLTVDGIERTFATNHLGYFLLTTLLLDLLIASAPARIVTVASSGHRFGTLDFDDLGYARGYWIMKAYRRSKLANVLFARELARRLAGTGVTSNSVHPGAVATNIWSGAPLWSKPLINMLWRPHFISAEVGGATIVQLAASPELDGVTGLYFDNFQPSPPAPLGQDDALARRLWEVSEQLTR
jgi:NAD(P)-dependent dehydrogenase (short-subunit alcohol dehydrogenase family)